MTIEDIRTLKHAKPFVPFEIVSSDGRSALVRHAYSIALSPTGRSMSGFDEKGRYFYFTVADVAELRTLQSPPAGV